MEGRSATTGAYNLTVYSFNTVVVGTGAAGYNAADRLHSLGQKDVAIVTEHVLAGTSRNTGSDKQTYYKLTLSGGDPDSVRDMADTLFSGQAVDGDVALCEAALSAQCFLHLVELGVPFPRNRWGEYIGYKTDHDPKRRATSVGPYTSRRMTECLQQSVQDKGIQVFDRMQVVKILGDGQKVYGLMCLDLNRPGDAENAFVLFNCKNIVYATGGPAGMYLDSVYPHGHYGASGLAFEAGAAGRNLTEWQYGLASVKPRWNVSGTYMQALPRVFSTDASGGDEQEFLKEYYKDKYGLLSDLFLKGYQWPFDVRKAAGGSSVIDLMVFRETARGRKVFLDYRQNPFGEEIDFAALDPEAFAYLDKAGACCGTPFERLRHMNAPAVDFYRDKGVDLDREPLQIALCAQHNNGGIGVDAWWRSNLEGLFAAGEAACTHGVYRPGGSALNAGQVGSLRAAQYIAAQRQGSAVEESVFIRLTEKQVVEMQAMAAQLQEGTGNVKEWWVRAAARMSRHGGPIRSREGIRVALEQTKQELAEFAFSVRAGEKGNLGMALRLRDMLLSQEMYLTAMADYLDKGGKSRGSALYRDPKGDISPGGPLSEFTFEVDDGKFGSLVQEICRDNDGNQVTWREVRPLPEDDSFFENVWRTYRESGNVY